MKILVDLDGIVADLLTKWLRSYNAEWNDTLTPKEIVTWDMKAHVNPKCGASIYGFLLRPGFFRDLPVIRGAMANLARIREMGHTIRFCTATPGPDAAACKLEWLYEHFGVKPEEVFICHAKSWIKADMLIDDSPDNLRTWKKAQDGLTVAIEYPYNAHLADAIDLLAPSYRDPATAWAHITSFVRSCDF